MGSFVTIGDAPAVLNSAGFGSGASAGAAACPEGPAAIGSACPKSTDAGPSIERFPVIWGSDSRTAASAASVCGSGSLSSTNPEKGTDAAGLGAAEFVTSGATGSGGVIKSERVGAGPAIQNCFCLERVVMAAEKLGFQLRPQEQCLLVSAVLSSADL